MRSERDVHQMLGKVLEFFEDGQRGAHKELQFLQLQSQMGPDEIQGLNSNLSHAQVGLQPFARVVCVRTPPFRQMQQFFNGAYDEWMNGYRAALTRRLHQLNTLLPERMAFLTRHLYPGSQRSAPMDDRSQAASPEVQQMRLMQQQQSPFGREYTGR